jgi:hypothetical protein
MRVFIEGVRGLVEAQRSNERPVGELLCIDRESAYIGRESANNVFEIFIEVLAEVLGMPIRSDCNESINKGVRVPTEDVKVL